MATHRRKSGDSAPASEIRVIEARGAPVVLDRDGAAVFGVETRALNQQVARNREKFGDDFAFRLSAEEVEGLRSQDVISSGEWGGARYQPMVFTEHGVVMAATVVKSARAVKAVRHIVKVFVESRREAAAVQSPARLPAPVDEPMRLGLGAKLNTALGQVLDAMSESRPAQAVKSEAKEIAAEGLSALKAYLKKAGVGNEKTLAEIRRILVEAEGIEVETARKRTENKHRQLALLAKQLRLIIEAQQYVETGSVEGLLAVLADLEKP